MFYGFSSSPFFSSFRVLQLLPPFCSARKLPLPNRYLHPHPLIVFAVRSHLLGPVVFVRSKLLSFFRVE